MLQIEFCTANGTMYCTSPEHTGVLTNDCYFRACSNFFCATVTDINTLMDSKPHFLTPQSEAKVTKSISNSTIRLGGSCGNPWLTISWTKVQEHEKEVAGKVDLKIF